MAANEIATAVANVIGTLMTERGTTRVELAEATGIPYATLHRRLQGGSKPFDLNELDAIARYFKTDLVAITTRANGAAA